MLEILTGSFLVSEIYDRDTKKISITNLLLQCVMWLTTILFYILFFLLAFCFYEWLSVLNQPDIYMTTHIEKKWHEHEDDMQIPITNIINGVSTQTMMNIPGYDTYNIVVDNISKTIEVTKQQWDSYSVGMSVKVGYKKSKMGLIFVDSVN